MKEKYILRYFPTSICPEGFGRKGRKGIGSVPLKKLERVAEILEKEGCYDNRKEVGDVIRYIFKKGGVINYGGLRGDDDLFTLSADVYVEVERMKHDESGERKIGVPYGSVEPVTGHKKIGLREARVVSCLKSLSKLSLENMALSRLILPVDPLEIEIINE